MNYLNVLVSILTKFFTLCFTSVFFKLCVVACLFLGLCFCIRRFLL